MLPLFASFSPTSPPRTLGAILVSAVLMSACSGDPTGGGRIDDLADAVDTHGAEADVPERPDPGVDAAGDSTPAPPADVIAPPNDSMDPTDAEPVEEDGAPAHDTDTTVPDTSDEDVDDIVDPSGTDAEVDSDAHGDVGTPIGDAEIDTDANDDGGSAIGDTDIDADAHGDVGNPIGDTGADVADPTGDVCFADIQCGGNDPCAIYRCVEGACTSTPATDGTSCQDLDACTTDDICIAGVCRGTAIADCGGVACDEDEQCVRFAGECELAFCVEGQCRVRVDIDAPCNITGPCLEGGVCARGIGGAFCSGVLASECDEPFCERDADCDDGNPCTRSTCDTRTGECLAPQWTYVGDCSDDPCVLASVCIAGRCQTISAVACDGPCIEPVCDGEGRCVPRPEGTVCDDGDPSTEGTVCVGGDCRVVVPGEPCNPAVLPFLSCTVEVRGEDGLCRTEPRAAGATCGLSTIPCLTPACDGDGSCVQVPVANGRTCSTPCGGGTCEAGVCEVGAGGCGYLDNACGQGACTGGECVYVSDDAACNATGSNCNNIIGRCNDGTCGNGLCTGTRLPQCDANWATWCSVNECPSDCRLQGCQVGCDTTTCASPLRDYPFRGTWRSAESVAYGFPLNVAHQTESLTRQLEDGVRMLHLRVDYCNPGASSGPICICAGDDRCATGGSTPLLARLQEIDTWMRARPNQVVILIFDQPTVSAAALRAVVDQSGLTSLLYAERVPTGHRFTDLLVDIIRHDRRLLVFAPSFLSPEFLFITDSRRRRSSDPEPGEDGYQEWYPGLQFPFALEGVPPVEEEECERLGQAPNQPRFYIVRHVLSASANGPLTSFQAAGCYNEQLRSHMAECGGRYPQIGSARHALVQFYNAGPGTLEPYEATRMPSGSISTRRPTCPGYAEFQSRSCGSPSPRCTSDDDCAGAGECTIFGNCVNCTSDANCPDDQFCDGSLRACVARRIDGTPCTRDRICASDRCTGVCTSCSTQEDCGAGRWCDVVGACRDQRPNGTLCVTGIECLSGSCHLGFCADCGAQSDCADPNEFCTLNPLPGESTCVARKPFGGVCAQNLECSSDLCDITCVDCTALPQRGCNFATQYCLAGRCNNKGALGATCGANNQCTSGNCHFGFCRTSCSGDAGCPSNQWCDGGACVPRVSNGTVCTRDRICQSGVCDVTCVDCTAVPQRGCNFSTQYCEAQQCLPKKALGQACAFNDQCTSGNCHLGFCRTSCSGDANCASSEWCDLGACVPRVANGTLCGRDRVCQSGVCDVTCVDCTAVPLRGCDFSAQYCETQQCRNKKANGESCGFNDQCISGTCHLGTCRQPCAARDSDCASNQWCDVFACVPQVPRGTPCSRDRVCQSGTCSFFLCT